MVTWGGEGGGLFSNERRSWSGMELITVQDRADAWPGRRRRSAISFHSILAIHHITSHTCYSSLTFNTRSLYKLNNTHTQTVTYRQTHTQGQTYRHIHRDRQTVTYTGSDRQTGTYTGRDRQTHTQGGTDSDIHRDRHTPVT